MNAIFEFLQGPNVWVLIPLGGILLGGVLAVLSIRHKHSERMAMIKRGIHPDASGANDDESGGGAA